MASLKWDKGHRCAAKSGKSICLALRASLASCSYKAISTNTAPNWFLIKHTKNIFEKCAQKSLRSSASLLSRNLVGSPPGL